MMKGVLVMAGAFLLLAPAMTWQQADQEKPCAAGEKKRSGLPEKAAGKRRGRNGAGTDGFVSVTF